MDKVSIIIPVYNSEKYIDRCLKSVLKQDYNNIEIICVNDGSKDNSLDILKKYEKSSKFIIIDQENIGVAKTRNKAIKKSTGDYILFIDNDDFIDSNYVSTYLNKAKESDCDVVLGGYKRMSSKLLFTKKIGKNSFSKFENMAPWAKIIKRDFLIENNIKFFPFSIGEDVIFNLNLYSSTDKIQIIDYCGYNWYYNDNSVSNTRQRMFTDNILVLFNEMKKYDKNDDVHYYIARYMVWYLLFSGSGVTPLEFMNEYKKINDWLIENGYGKELKISKIIKNESSFKNKIIIISFYYLVKFHLLGLFSRTYCKGRK